MCKFLVQIQLKVVYSGRYMRVPNRWGATNVDVVLVGGSTPPLTTITQQAT